MINSFIRELREVVRQRPDTCVLVFRGWGSPFPIIFSNIGPEASAKDEVAACEKYLTQPTLEEILTFQKKGYFDYISAIAAANWLADDRTPWKLARVGAYGEYGEYAYVYPAPNRAVRAYCTRIDNIIY